MKRIVAIMVAVSAFYALADDTPYVAYVEALYEISAGKSSVIQIDDNPAHDITIKGVSITTSHIPVGDAVSQYMTKYYELSDKLDGNSSINKSVRLASLASWAERMQVIINDGLSRQETENANYAAKFGETLEEQTTLFNSKQSELSTKTATLSASQASIAANITGLAAEVSASTLQTQTELESITKQLDEIAKRSVGGVLTPEDQALKAQLEAQQIQLTSTQATALQAQTLAQKQAAEIASLKYTMNNAASLHLMTNNFVALSKWLGFKDGSSEGQKNPGNFVEANKFKQKNGDFEVYDIENGDTIYTQLRDAGYVGAFDDYMKERWNERGGVPKWHFELKEETVSGVTRTNCYTDAHDSDGKPTQDATGAYNNLFPPPRNWVDGTSIVCTDGVYRATSYTNAENGVEEERKRRGGGGGGGGGGNYPIFGRPDQEVNLNDPNDPLNPNSVLYPLNPSYDPDNVDNAWFHLFTHTDSDITWSKYVQSEELGQLSSIIDLGKDLYTRSKFNKNLTNVYSLANFPMTHPYQFPFVHIANPGTRYSIRDLCWADSTNCFEVTENDSQPEYPEVEYEFAIKGFAAASEWQVPYKHKTESKNPDGSDHYDIAWTNALGMTVMTEHNGATAEQKSGEGAVPVNVAVGGQRLIFRTADDSDVRINVSTNATGDVILTFGVYWK